jgi:PAS domain S-box-containing protein
MFTGVFSQFLAFTPRRLVTNYMIGIACVLMGLMLRWAFFPLIHSATHLYLFLYVAILVSSFVGGLKSGIVSLIVSFCYIVFATATQPLADLQDNVELRLGIFSTVSLISSYVLSYIKDTYHFSMSVLNNLHSFVVILTPRGRFVDVNQSMLDTFGVSRQFVIGKSLFGRFPWRFPANVTLQLKRALIDANRGKSSRLDVKVVFSSQDVVFLDCSFAPIFDSQHNVVRIVVSASDVTSRVKAENNVSKLNQSLQQKLSELNRSELRFKRLVASNVIGVTIAHLNGEILEANEAFSTMIGYSQDEIKKGQVNWKKMTPPEFKTVDEKATAQLKASGEARPYEKEFLRKDGSRLPILLGVAMLEASKDKSVAFVVDNTARKRLEKRKDEFIGLASHELKTPLTTIRVFTQLLERSLVRENDQKNLSYLLKIDRQITRLSSLVEDLLDISKIEAGKLSLNYERIDLNQLIENSVSAIQAITEDHELTVEGSVKNRIWADPYRIEQVVTNLLTNAIKYSPKSSKVVISIDETPTEMGMKVTDYGVGIPETQQTKVFEKFFRAQGKNRHSFPGLGLGLYLSKQIIDRHGGTIWLQSQEGKGSTFGFKLPKKRTYLS